MGYSWSILLPELEEPHDTLAQESTVFNKHTRSGHHAAAPLQPHGGRTGVCPCRNTVTIPGARGAASPYQIPDDHPELA